MFSVGLSTFGAHVSEELLEKYKNAGIEKMELDPAGDILSVDFSASVALAKAYGVDIWSLHLPYGPFDKIDMSKRELCDYTISFYGEVIKKAAHAGIDKVIIHPSGEPITPEERSTRLACAKESFYRLGESSKKEGVTICVEDLPRTCLGNCSDEILEILHAHDALRACFDTNHLLFEDPVDFIHKVGNKIITLHVSDYDAINERHWLPGEGKNNWQAILKALQEVNYQGPWLYEIGLATPPTILRERELTHADFVRNAKEIFENKPLTNISKQILV